MSSSSTMGSPIPLLEIEGVLAWVDTFKLSRPTKKIHRDFSDAVLLAEMLSVHYPKLVEMHNYPPRNSHALKLNNWMTLNRKVLKKLKLNLCCNTMEQLANCTPGIIERVLIMVRDRIRRDEELNKSSEDQNTSSGGSYYEACGDDENVLMVPVKARVNGVLETMQQKVVSHDVYLSMKEQLKDALESNEMLKQKVEHLDSLMNLKDERIDELQKQLDRKQARRKDAKDVECFQSVINVPFPPETPTPVPEKVPSFHQKPSSTSLNMISSKISLKETLSCKDFKTITQVTIIDKDELNDVERIQSNVFKDAEIVDLDYDINEIKNVNDPEVFKDIPGDISITTIEETIQQEIHEIAKPVEEVTLPGYTYVN